MRMGFGQKLQPISLFLPFFSVLFHRSFSLRPFASWRKIGGYRGMGGRGCTLFCIYIYIYTYTLTKYSILLYLYVHTSQPEKRKKRKGGADEGDRDCGLRLAIGHYARARPSILKCYGKRRFASISNSIFSVLAFCFCAKTILKKVNEN